MPRPQKRAKRVDTDFFNDVSPMWQPPGREAVPREFQEAVEALADWIGPNWYDQEYSGFFLLRNDLIRTVMRWQGYDWASDRVKYNRERDWKESRPKIGRAATNLLHELTTGNDPPTRRLFSDVIRNAFSTRAAPAQAMWQNSQAVVDSIEVFSRAVLATTPRNGRFGPLELSGFPALAGPIVAMAILLADRITCLRRDIANEKLEASNVRRSRWSGLPPRSSRRLPWRAIGLFAAQAIPDDIGDDYDFDGLQSRAERFSKQVARLHLDPLP